MTNKHGGNSANTAEVLRAAALAAKLHEAQRRKGEAAEPYVNHLIEVAHLLAEAGAPSPVVIAGLLHDAIEDTWTAPWREREAAADPAKAAERARSWALHLESMQVRLAAGFGAEVAALVAACTDDKSVPSDARKAAQVETAARKSAGARMVKIADKISNLRALVASPPRDWPAARKQDYVRWCAAVVAGCRGVNAALESEFDAVRAEAAQRLGVEG